MQEEVPLGAPRTRKDSKFIIGAVDPRAKAIASPRES